MFNIIVMMDNFLLKLGIHTEIIAFVCFFGPNASAYLFKLGRIY